MREYSEVFNRYYDSDDGIIILNPKQSSFYLEKGVPLLDVYSSDGTLILVFKRSATKQWYQQWKEMRPKQNTASGGD